MIRSYFGILFLLMMASSSASGDEVLISRKLSFEQLGSEVEVSLGRFDLSRLESSVEDFSVKVDYRSMAGESVSNPADQDFDFQYWIESEVFLVGRKGGEEIFEISSDQYEVIDLFVEVAAGESILREFPDDQVFEQLVGSVAQCEGGEIELFFRVRQSMGGGTVELSMLEGYRDVEVEVSLEFTTSLPPSASSSIDLVSELRGPGEGVVNFMTRQGFEYHLIWAESFDSPTIVETVMGTSTDQTFTFADLGIVSEKGFFWVEEFVAEDPE